MNNESYYTTKKNSTSIDHQGNPSIEKDNKYTYAKRTSSKFFIKSKGNILIDPNCLYEKDLYQKVGDHDVWQWKEVSGSVFETYLLYLKTNNKTYYRNACREIM